MSLSSLSPAASATSTTRLSQSRPFRLGAFLLITGFLVIYAVTLDTGLQPHELQGGDLITHQYAQVQARPSNAPGYPIYTMGGWLWFHGWHKLLNLFGQTQPNPIPILSSYSTLWAILALWLFYAILGHLLGNSGRPWQDTFFCLLLTAFYGVTYFFWYYATTTEQYSSAVAQTLAIVYLYLRWDEAPTRRSLLYWLAFLCGLSLAHMLTVAFIVPPLVAVVLWRDPSLLRSPRAILTALAAASVPLLSYLYVYLRGALNPQWWGRGNWAATTPAQWFWGFVSTAQGRDELSWAFEPGRTFWGNGFPELTWQELSLPLLALGLLGIAFLPRRHAVLLYGTLLLYAIFCWMYRFGNWFQVVLPAYPLILLGIVPFYDWQRFHETLPARLGRILILAALLVSIGWRVTESLPGANSRQRAEDTALNRAAIFLDQPLPQSARIFAAVDDALALSYLTEIWGLRPDLKMATSRDANAILASGGEMYAVTNGVTALFRELRIQTNLDSLSADWVVLTPYTKTVETAPIASSVLYTITPELQLAGISASPAPDGDPLSPPTTPALDLLLTWRLPSGVWPADLAVSLRPTLQGQQLLDPQSGHPIQQDRQRPIYGLWADKLSGASEANPVIVHDAYRLPLPTALPDTVDGVLLILYTHDASGFHNIAEIPISLSDIMEQ